MDALSLFKCLADETRLSVVLLIWEQGELCVCELTAALALSQPKVSRHLGQLRDCGLLSTRRAGQWVYYAINSELPPWVQAVIDSTAASNPQLTAGCCQRLLAMGDRPQRNRQHCGETA
ncbi:ArsR family transcriptional regulator [Seongchinamella sediminis]|uniref:ArsR family transcriptional regulator n=1 Tax=Seongchinamella sediminis TaxID=2283635 RepID=A0A3L7E1X8_9GAMM|nr:metalloregulator ArsR/SmtB family transcription factor [Seongchinamella sediminis]RLQ22152.1 ArsR family transcriptional regulator [Seongchinamella sediminis]